MKRLFCISCFAASAILLTVIQPPFDLSFLAWVALVPFIIGSLACKKFWLAALIAYAVSLLYWLGNIYWLAIVTIPGWLAFSLYIAIYWPVIALALRYCFKRQVPLWFALPVLVVGAEALQGIIFGGFCWRYLGHSQYKNITIIQIADLFGVAAISFLIAMVNGLIADIIINCRSIKTRSISSFNVIGIVITVLAVIAAIFYGKYRIGQTAGYLEKGPRIGIVQSNVPTAAGKITEPPEQTFLNALIDSRNCLLSARPLLIVWPETIVEAVLDESYLKLVADDDTSKVFHNALTRHSDEGVYLLIGAFAGDAVRVEDRVKLKKSYNSAFLYEPNQPTVRQKYNKIHLVPFGEYIPLKDLLPPIGKILIKLTPYDYDYTLNAGTDWTVFKIKDVDKNYRFAVMICYEDTIPKIARRFALNESGQKQVDWLVNISNDGWFVRQKNGKIEPSTELRQHMAVSVFRAVENRLPVIRSANTGISCYIDSLGKIHDSFEGTLPKNTIERAAKKGWCVQQVLIDKRITFFSQAGQNLETVCAVCLILTAIMSIYKRKDLQF